MFFSPDRSAINMTEFVNNRNPLLPLDIHIPDGEPHVMPDAKLYIYGSYDALENEYCSREYHVVSTKDLIRWTVHEKSFSTADIPWLGAADLPSYPQIGPDWRHPSPVMKRFVKEMIKNTSLKDLIRMARNNQKPSEGPLLFAPDCIYKDGKYYLYFCLNNGEEGVAVSDRPEGPFSQAKRLSCAGIDPAVFVDADGRAYYYWGQIASCGVMLNDDMISFAREGIAEKLVTEEAHFFHEGSSMRKIGDTYYYIFADAERGKPTALGYATSKSPLGTFTYQGILIDNQDCDPKSWNNHGSIECFHGQWYLFYHRSTRNSDKHRRMCAEKITVLPDGTIPEVKMTSQGLGEPFAPGETIMGYQVCGFRGKAYIDIDHAAESTENMEIITNIHKGDEIIFRYICGENTYTQASLSTRGEGSLQIYFEDVLVGKATIKGRSTEVGRTSVKLQNIMSLPNEPLGYEVRLRCTKAKHLQLEKLCFQ